MPAVFSLGDLDGVEATSPVASELVVPQAGECFSQFYDVPALQVPDVLHREDEVLGLVDEFCPPFDLLAAVTGECGGALRAAEQIAPVREFARQATSATEGYGVVGVAVLQLVGEGVLVAGAQLGGDGVLLGGCRAPDFKLPGPNSLPVRR